MRPFFGRAFSVFLLEYQFSTAGKFRPSGSVYRDGARDSTKSRAIFFGRDAAEDRRESTRGRRSLGTLYGGINLSNAGRWRLRRVVGDFQSPLNLSKAGH